MASRDFHDGWMRKMIVMVVGDYHRIDNWDVLDAAWHLSEALWAHEGDRRATVLEYRVEQNS